MKTPALQPNGADGALTVPPTRASAQEKVFKVGTLVYSRKALIILFCWLLWGDLCFQLMEHAAAGITPLKFRALGAPNWVMGLILGTIAATLNTIFNPIISFKSDRHRSHWGRRIPFIVITMPMLVACLYGVACSDAIGHGVHRWAQSDASAWLHTGVRQRLVEMGADTLALWALSVSMTLFAFFNLFVGSVFWYLFNDVVPQEVMGRFMSLFRIVLYANAIIYGLWILPYGESHFTQIMAGMATLYLVGFGVMCLFVREGQYAPAPPYVGRRPGAIAAIKTYARECGGLTHYWFLFLASSALALGGTLGPFIIFFQNSIGLDLTMIGRLGAIGSVAGLIAVPVSGWLADKFHPIRVVLWGLVLQLLVATPLGCVWLMWMPSPKVVFWITAVNVVLITAPISALMMMFDPPLLMRIFPRDRYGQFCSANAMCRSVVIILFGTLTGVYFDVMKGVVGESISYRTLPLVGAVATLLTLVFVYLLYRSWQAYGGDAAYVAPIPGETRAPVGEVAASPVPAPAIDQPAPELASAQAG